MAFGTGTFNALGGAVNDLFSSQLGSAGQRLQAQGERISADSTRIGAQSLRINAQGMRIKAQGDISEADTYDLTGGLARQNAEFTRQSTAIQQMQIERSVNLALGQTRSDVAGAGFAASGSALDLLRDSASQGALTKQVAGYQGLITEAGYQEQAQSYDIMSNAARWASGQEMDIAGQIEQQATRTDQVAGSMNQVASGMDALAKKTETFGEISAGIKGATAIASLFI